MCMGWWHRCISMISMNKLCMELKKKLLHLLQNLWRKCMFKIGLFWSSKSSNICLFEGGRNEHQLPVLLIDIVNIIICMSAYFNILEKCMKSIYVLQWKMVKTWPSTFVEVWTAHCSFVCYKILTSERSRNFLLRRPLVNIMFCWLLATKITQFFVSLWNKRGRVLLDTTSISHDHKSYWVFDKDVHPRYITLVINLSTFYDFIKKLKK